jgi:hypothetical protein
LPSMEISNCAPCVIPANPLRLPAPRRRGGENFSHLVEWCGHAHNRHQWERTAAMPDIRFVVYDPPQDGYPFLAVALSPTEVSAVAYDTRQEAEAHNAARATEAARARPGDHDAE